VPLRQSCVRVVKRAALMAGRRALPHCFAVPMPSSSSATTASSVSCAPASAE
jgi:hypothetical protein